MSTERIAEIRERLEKATDGPWKWALHDTSVMALYGPQDEMDHVLWSEICPACAERGNRCTAPSDNDAAFIAHAREDIPWFLTRLEDAREVMEFYGDSDTWGKSLDNVYVQSPLGNDRNTAPNGTDCPGAKARRWLKGEG